LGIPSFLRLQTALGHFFDFTDSHPVARIGIGGICGICERFNLTKGWVQAQIFRRNMPGFLELFLWILAKIAELYLWILAKNGKLFVWILENCYLCAQ
jgi:hypothetical protein